MNAVAVVILNYNGRNYLEQFLPALVKFSEGTNIVVADNASTDDSVDWMKAHYPGIDLVILDQNYGFAGGYNEALKQIDADYYILINSDVEVTSHWWQPLVKYLDENPTYAACQPKINAYHNKDQFEYAGACGGFIDSLGYPYCRGRIFDVLEIDHGQYDQTIDIFWATGACMIIRAELFHEYGGFDPDFFAHMEEVDLCWRLKNAQWSIACIPESKVYHVGGGTLDKSNPRKTYLNFRNSLAVITKNLPGYTLWWKLPLRIALDLLAAVVFWKTNSYEHFNAVLTAIVDFLKNFGKHFAKRRTLNSWRVTTARTSRVAVIFDFFIRKKKKFADL
ncbi:MAG: glycosyltransferase family 2 protein [Cytophagales bacterium]|nr:glycosyltransferase family 2 protein [Cytophagales bacterium]